MRKSLVSYSYVRRKNGGRSNIIEIVGSEMIAKQSMKFKASLTDTGVHLLEKRVLPALEKMGRSCHVYITPSHFSFLHNLLNSDGVQSVAQFRREALFSEYRFSSQTDKISFSLDLALLQRALRSLSASGADRFHFRLLKKLTPHSPLPSPFLTFEARGHSSALIQDVPISRPLSRADLQELQSALENAQLIPPSLLQLDDLTLLQGFVDRMKSVGEALTVSISKYGDLHLQISTGLITLGSEFRSLLVMGEKADMPDGDQGVTAQARTQRALQRGDAMTVQLSVKHFYKALQCHLAKPDSAYFGIATQGSCLTVIFDFFISGTRIRDNAISFYCRLPVLDTGST